MLSLDERTAIRFWSHVIKGNGCWEWSARIDEKGYGRFNFHRKNRHAHRIAWMYSTGTYPKAMICHHCDNRKCVRPDHLYEGTAKDNGRDARLRGRMVQGAAHRSAKLSGHIADIRKMLIGGASRRSVARAYGVHHATINALASGRTWKREDR